MIVRYFAEHPGSTGAQAREALGFAAGQWATYVARTLHAGQLRREGAGREARYWAA